MVGVQALKCLHSQRTTSFDIMMSLNTASCCFCNTLVAWACGLFTTRWTHGTGKLYCPLGNYKKHVDTISYVTVCARAVTKVKPQITQPCVSLFVLKRLNYSQRFLELTNLTVQPGRLWKQWTNLPTGLNSFNHSINSLCNTERLMHTFITGRLFLSFCSTEEYRKSAAINSKFCHTKTKRRACYFSSGL